MRTLSAVRFVAASLLLTGLSSCGHLADVASRLLPAELPLTEATLPVETVGDAARVVYFRAQPTSSLPPEAGSLLPELKLGGRASLSAGPDLTVDWYARTTVDGCTPLPGTPGWTCPAAGEDAGFLGRAPVGTAVQSFGPWAHPRLKQGLLSNLFIGLRVSDGVVTPGTTMNVNLSLLTR
ncbi:hypothetical protein DEIGR_101143 [Deinococcus grandis]|uniref:Lipoprotein n=1 Tax=Deinococcus grandis TaxID=57498 RepID=A0A100HI05_9DEIO|nr:hypothetical protein [Deinococcus grandis]BBN95394.1 hypothetical protein DEGR_21270 [Deinococcus grandis]GAQ21116.1 hypothetical protein DEIGR_101143 [Deinococcus grandis]